MFSIFRKYDKNSILEESKIKWNEIDEKLLKYIKVDKEIFEKMPILSQQLIIQSAVVDKENDYVNFKKIEEKTENEIVLFNDNENFNDFLNNIELYAQQNLCKFISVNEKLKNDKNVLYKRIKSLERNIKNNKDSLKNIEKNEKKKILKYNNNILKYEDELYIKTCDHRIKKILYEITLEVIKTVERKNNIENGRNNHSLI